MQYTSAQANKLLKKLNEEHERLLSLERAGKVFIAATTEDKESARPEYSYEDTKKHLLRSKRISERSNMQSTCSTPHILWKASISRLIKC